MCTVSHELVILAPHTHMNMAHCNLQHEHANITLSIETVTVK